MSQKNTSQHKKIETTSNTTFPSVFTLQSTDGQRKRTPKPNTPQRETQASSNHSDTLLEVEVSLGHEAENRVLNPPQNPKQVKKNKRRRQSQGQRHKKKSEQNQSPHDKNEEDIERWRTIHEKLENFKQEQSNVSKITRFWLSKQSLLDNFLESNLQREEIKEITQTFESKKEESVQLSRYPIRNHLALGRYSNYQSEENPLEISLLENLDNSVNQVEIKQNEPETIKPSPEDTQTNRKLKDQFSREILDIELAPLRENNLPQDFHRISTKLWSMRADRRRGGRQQAIYLEQIPMTLRSGKIKKLKILNINFDMNEPSVRQDYIKKEKVYIDTQELQRSKQLIGIVRTAMLVKVDFIFIQEACKPNIRNMIRKLVQEFQFESGDKYYYPDNLLEEKGVRTTLILSKHRVRFGQLRFQIKDREDQREGHFNFPLQAFCEFEILVKGQVETIAMLSCHLRSNGSWRSEVKPWTMRRMQISCLYDWGTKRNYHRFFIIGDTNLLTGDNFKKHEGKDAKFYDSYQQGHSQSYGSFLFYNSSTKKVTRERNDRVLMNEGSEKKTVIKMKYKDILLQSCQGKGYDKEKMLIEYSDQFTHISPSDHEIMDISIYFTAEVQDCDSEQDE